MQLSKEKVLEILKSKGVDVRELAKNPAACEKAYKVAYKAIRVPWRWFVGKKRVRKFVDMAVNKAVA